MQNLDYVELLKQINEFKVYNTKNHGRVKILMKDSYMWGSAGKVVDGKECIRVKTETGTPWIPISEIIIPKKKKPLTGAEKKRRFDAKQKSLSKKRITVDLDYDAYLLISTIKDAIEKNGSKANYSEIVSKLLIFANQKISINEIVKVLF